MPSSNLPFGLWPSPLTAADLAQEKRLRDVAWDTDGRTLVWLEGRGADGVLLCQQAGQAPRELNPAGPSARARVGYGGGDFCVSHGNLYFAADERLYRQELAAGKATPLTPAFGQTAAPTVSADGRFVVFVHALDGHDRLAVVDTAGAHWPQILAAGADFYMQAAWHPRGRQLAWVEWDQPQMPWDGSRLVVATLTVQGGLPRLKDRHVVAGDADTAVFQPTFSPDGRYLAYASDERGWSNLWLMDLTDGQRRCLTPDQYDIARPAWVQGLRVFSFAADGNTLYFTRCQAGRLPLYALDLADDALRPVEAFSAYGLVQQPIAAPRGRGLAAIVEDSGVTPRVVAWDGRRLQVRARASSEAVPPEHLSAPKPVSWTAADSQQVHGLYYPPAGTAHSDGSPPLILMVHGGPTSQALAGYEARNQYFATRGWAVLDLNYRGSTGYGRAYMQALNGQWGVADVEDAVSGARHLVEQDLAAADRLVIMGGSAGGFTVLRAMEENPGFFRAGVCLYGVTDLFALAADTHKFEARYLDALVGPLPQAAALYRERSPLANADRLKDPIAVFQGADDQVVPPAQAEAIVASLRRRNIPHHYSLFAGEGHGWRRPDTIQRFYRETEDFLRQYVLFS